MTRPAGGEVSPNMEARVEDGTVQVRVSLTAWSGGIQLWVPATVVDEDESRYVLECFGKEFLMEKDSRHLRTPRDSVSVDEARESARRAVEAQERQPGGGLPDTSGVGLPDPMTWGDVRALAADG